MQKRHEIVLPHGTRYVKTFEILELIAVVLHPKPEDDLDKIVELFKIPHSVITQEYDGCFDIEPLSEADKIYLDVIWEDLPKLTLPIAERDWKQYETAFNQYKPAYKKKLIFVASNLTACNLSTLSITAIEAVQRYRQEAKSKHQPLLQAAIESGKLRQLDPVSHIQITTYLENGKVAVNVLQDYISEFEIDLRIDNAEETGETCAGESISARDLDAEKPIASIMDREKSDDPLDDLFDPVTHTSLEKMFPSSGKWEAWAERANRNGLKAARSGRGLFNPYKAALWFLKRGVADWDLARCNRVLVNNLPPRSIDRKHLLTGDLPE